jgi:hypothetical protein
LFEPAQIKTKGPVVEKDEYQAIIKIAIKTKSLYISIRYKQKLAFPCK